MVYAFWIVTADVMPVCFAGVFIVVVCPLVDDFIVIVPDIGVKGSPRNPAGAAE